MQKIIPLLLLACMISCTIIAQSNIIKAEYFFNTDPGFGKANPIPVTVAVNIQDMAYSIPINFLPVGFNTLYLRSANAADVWSITNHLLFFKTASPAAVNLIAAEYFIDTDPGFGMATSVIPPPNSTDVSDKFVAVDIATLSLGLHTLYIRSKDTNGKWSITNYFMFLKAFLPSAVNIIAAEYFIDTDPGFGMADAIVPLTATIDMPDKAVSVEVGSLTTGLHTLYIRTKDANGKWSITNYTLFYKTSTTLPLITEAEYFIDTDPGFGKASKFPSLPQSTNVADYSFNIDITGADTGMHRLFIRSKDTNNKWSITNYLEFRKGSALPLRLLSFEAVALNNQVALQWETTNEKNTGFFDIEHSVNGVSFSKVGIVTAKDFSSSKSDYSFLHVRPSLNSLNFYRLKQVDKDGKYTYSPIRTVKLSLDRKFVISPNPVQTKLKIYTSEQGLTLHIFESTGKKVLSRQIPGYAISIDFSLMAKGMYYAVAEKNGKPVYTQKILKQ